MAGDRFAYETNLDRAAHYRDWRSSFWPPGDSYGIFCLDLANKVPALGARLTSELETLRALIDVEWQQSKLPNAKRSRQLNNPRPVADALRRIAPLLPKEADRTALELRAGAVEHGYTDDGLATLATLDEDVAFVVGRISTWYGKQAGGLPTAFGCTKHVPAQAVCDAAVAQLDDIRSYLRGLHTHLRCGAAPKFLATDVFFMAGEGNRHPKHIAYFLPEDEGVKYSTFKKTYYFLNTHRALLGSISLPLAERLLRLDSPTPRHPESLEPIPTLGVLAHEMGHFVQREGTTFVTLNAADRWASVVLQEAAADVFGILTVAQVLAPKLGIAPGDVVLYHLAECLRYLDRGLGFFPDSDGMYLQLNYLVAFGALRFESSTAPRLVGEAAAVVAALRSLARVFADTLLCGQVERTLALHRGYGPSADIGLKPLIAALRAQPQKSIEYLQEPPAFHAEGT